MAVRRYEISFEEKISPSKRPCNVLFTIAGFHTVRAWVRVRVLLDYQHKTLYSERAHQALQNPQVSY